jgi:hypothetical protein
VESVWDNDWLSKVEMKMMQFRVVVVMTLAALVALGAGSASQAKNDAAPSFKPGAQVTLAIKLKAPSGWKISHVPPIRLSFDKQQLKNYGFTVAKNSFDFDPGKYVKEYTANIPIKLKAGVKDGALKVPVNVSCSICDDAVVQCSFANESMELSVQVLAKAPAGSTAQAQAKGTVSHEHTLRPPE